MNSCQIDFRKQKLPPIYKRQGKDCYLDFIREKLIFITPEETVRQQVISYLLNELNVPKKMIDVELHLSHYGIESNRRVDILINKYDETSDVIEPLCVVECKAPTVMLGESAQNQMMDYCDALGCNYSMITNGYEVQCFRFDESDNTYKMIAELPKYLDLVKGEFKNLPEIKLLPRLSYEELSEKENWKSYIGSDFGESLDRNIAIPMTNLWECLIYPDHKFPSKQYKLFKVIEDLGVRILSYGNASGGGFQGAYRSFLIEYKGSTEIVSLGFSSYISRAKQGLVKTSLCVAIDNEKDTHHSLQLVIDDNVLMSGSAVTFYHSGRIGISNKGSGKIDELRSFVDASYPEIIDGKKFNLGTLDNTHLWNLDDPDVMKMIENLISYALVRDEYRSYVKNKKE